MTVFSQQFKNIKTNSEARILARIGRWQNGFVCPRCGSTEGTQLKTRDVIQCRVCRKQTSPTANTGLHKTKSLALIFRLADKMITGQHESTMAIAKELHKNYSTIWNLIHKVRLAIEFFMTFEPAAEIECSRLRTGIFKPSSEEADAWIPPDSSTRIPKPTAPDGVVKDAILFFLAVFLGVSRKYSQLYLNEFAIWSSGMYPTPLQITLSLLRPVSFRSAEVYRYRSPPVVLFRQQQPLQFSPY